MKYKKGFTLIELLVVIAIIGILSSVVFASLNSARVKARDAKRQADIRQVKLALEFYYDDNGVYPSIGSDNTGYNISGLVTPLSPQYIPTIPIDPVNSGSSIYQYVRGPQADSSYAIRVGMENTSVCKTGVNVNTGWWGSGTLLCSF